MRTITENQYLNSPLESKKLSDDIVTSFKTKFYQCEFNQIIELVDEELKEIDKISDYYKVIMIKAKSYFELNRRDLANGVLEEATDQKTLNQHADYFYTKGSFHYFKG